ncbi:MAG: response regulator [Myxococcales bacterium]|nr:response regulator [Myxococcales bacterium]
MASRILIVDDSEAVRRMHGEALQNDGHQVITACNGAEGLALARSEQIHLFLVDLNMPVMTGSAMVRELRNMPEYRDTPVFVLSSESSHSMVMEMRALGVTAWILKPVRTDLLQAAVNQGLGLKRRPAEQPSVPEKA